ncbi:MAG: sec-independent translocase [Actinomycetota bacterium]|jgi:sec-independent protein translocase protein TatB
MLDIGAGELLGLALVALVLVGPSKLPTFAADAARFLRKVRGFAQSATSDLRENLGPGFEDLSVSDLNPKSFIRKQMRQALEDEPALDKNSVRQDPQLP